MIQSWTHLDKKTCPSRNLSKVTLIQMIQPKEHLIKTSPWKWLCHQVAKQSCCLWRATLKRLQHGMQSDEGPREVILISQHLLEKLQVVGRATCRDDKHCIYGNTFNMTNLPKTIACPCYYQLLTWKCNMEKTLPEIVVRFVGSFDMNPRTSTSGSTANLQVTSCWEEQLWKNQTLKE